MQADLWTAQQRVDAVYEFVTDGMFHRLRLTMNLIGLKAHLLHQVEFEQAMGTQHFASQLLPCWAQAHAAVGRVGHPSQLGQPLEHLGGRGGNVIEVGSHPAGAGFNAGLVQDQNRLQVVLNRCGWGRRLKFSHP